MTNPLPISGYVLAGGRSSRMGTDKALLQLAGKPLIEHAVAKLRRVCADVFILSSDPALAAYAPLVPDVHPNCGPIGGMEAALMHSPHDWNVFLPVDMPFLPTGLIENWVGCWTIMPLHMLVQRLFMFTAYGRPQPGFCLLHQDVALTLSHAILCGDYALMSAFERAGRELGALRHSGSRSALWNEEFTGTIATPADTPTTACILPYNQAQLSAQHLWFVNLNTPEDFALAEAHADALDT